MTDKPLRWIVIATLALGAGHAAAARTGAEVVEAQCAMCHATGRDGAPRIGDAKAWAPRAKRGLPGLTQTAIEGVRKMPPHCGKIELPDLEIQRAITYMVNMSGGGGGEPEQ